MAAGGAAVDGVGVVAVGGGRPLSADWLRVRCSRLHTTGYGYGSYCGYGYGPYCGYGYPGYRVYRGYAYTAAPYTTYGYRY
jgi:hypothetical protein